MNVGKVEIGQHIHEAFQKIVAIALAISPEHIIVAPVTTATSPNDGLTAGSLSIQVTGAELQSSAVCLRATLIDEAARKFKADASDVALDGATLEVSAGERRCSVFELPVVQSCFIMENLCDFGAQPSIAGSIRGTRLYIQDLIFPGMVHARALRGRGVGNFDRDNVRVIREGGFTALIAKSEAALESAWAGLGSEPGDRDSSCDGPVTDWMENRKVHTRTIGKVSLVNGGVNIRATRPFLLHASIAPSCAIARFQNGTLEIWTHSQGIFQLRDTIAHETGIELGKIIVRHVPSAGCYGHNAADDAAMDAVLACMQNKGVAVRVVWSRQDEFRHAPVGAPMIVQVQANLVEDGSINSWRQTIWSGPHGQRPGGGGNVNLLAAIERNPELKSKAVHDLPDAVGGGASRNAVPPYVINAFGATTHIVQDLPVRTSSIRGLGAQMNIVAIEAAMDELATSCALDPLEFRLRHISDPRGAEVLRRLRSALEARSLRLQDDEAVGVGYARYKGRAAYAAVAVRIRLADKVELLDVWVEVDAGYVIDISGALNQIEGGIIQAASWTLCEGALLHEGYIDAEGWDDYPIIGWSDIPNVHANFVNSDSDVPPLGVGECMVGPVTAAIVSGVSKIAGCTIADLPLTRERIISAIVAD